jgi:radical SAM/Cys-rich protein
VLTINNMPIARFLDFLWESGNYDDYMERLIDAYNPAAVAGLMCKNTLSVAYDGRLFDCDFNQMLDMPVRGSVATLADWVAAGPEARAAMLQREVVTANHCYGCTAGAGSSCQGALT